MNYSTNSQMAAGVRGRCGLPVSPRTPAPLEDGPMDRSQPPFTNRGVGLTQRPDFLVGTTWGRSVDEVKSILSDFLEESDFVDFDKGGNFYQFRAEGFLGAKLYWSEDREDICVWLSGRVCEFLGLDGCLGVAACLDLRVSRLDWCWDDCPFAVADIQNTWHSGQVNSKVPRDSFTELRNAKGSTFYIGGKKSDRRLVCYDMRGFTRLELRMRGERSDEVFKGLCGVSSYEEMSDYMMGVLTGYCDFVDRTVADSNVSRAPRLDWWQEFVGAVDRIRMAGRNVAAVLDRAISHAVNRCSTSIYTYVEAAFRWGKTREEALWHLFETGRRRKKARHDALVLMACSSQGLSFSETMDLAPF